MKIMAKEYCRQCPFFIEEKGWMEDNDAYWKEHPDSECMCKKCPNRAKCEESGPEQDAVVCILAIKGVVLEATE